MAAAAAGSGAGSSARGGGGGGGSSTASRWFFSREQLENTPSRRCGVEADKELSYRQQAANLIQDMGQRLNVYPSGAWGGVEGLGGRGRRAGLRERRGEARGRGGRRAGCGGAAGAPSHTHTPTRHTPSLPPQPCEGTLPGTLPAPSAAGERRSRGMELCP